jgi:hypothetical protein
MAIVRAMFKAEVRTAPSVSAIQDNPIHLEEVAKV